MVEFLASGTPLVTTAPEELAFYFKDKVNAFVADRDDPETVASKILEALQDYDFAIKVAQNGGKLARGKFNPFTQTKKIIDFANLYSL